MEINGILLKFSYVLLIKMRSFFNYVIILLAILSRAKLDCIQLWRLWEYFGCDIKTTNSSWIRKGVHGELEFWKLKENQEIETGSSEINTR